MRRVTWLVAPALLLGGCLMSRVEFAEGTGGSGGSGASSNGGSGASSNGGGGGKNNGSAGSNASPGGADGDAGEGPGAGGTQPKTGGTGGSAGSAGSGGSGITTVCGDSVVEGAEECDDGNDVSGDGCYLDCDLELYFSCDIPGRPCFSTPIIYNGVSGEACGDGFVSGAEGCDDGNVDNLDGCSSTCTEEAGHSCAPLSDPELPEQWVLAAVYRDFITLGINGGQAFRDMDAIGITSAGINEGMVQDELISGRPWYTGLCEEGSVDASCSGPQTSSQVNFDNWFVDSANVNARVDGVLALSRVGATETYEFDGGARFSPVLGRGWDLRDMEATLDDGNWGFTTVLRVPFVLHGGEEVTFTGNDDVWIFINNRLVVDMGGKHQKATGSFTLTAQQSAVLGMTMNGFYALEIFHAQRRAYDSNFKLTLTGFTRRPSVCTP